MARKYSPPRVPLVGALCPNPIGAIYLRNIPCSTNWFADVVRIVIKLRSDASTFVSNVAFENEGTWTTLFTISPFTTGAVMYSPDFGDKGAMTPRDPNETTNSWGDMFYSDYKGSQYLIQFWNLPPDVQGEMYKSINSSPNGLDVLFVTKRNTVIYLNDNAINPVATTTPYWIPAQAAKFGEFATATGQAQMTNNLMLTFYAGHTSYFNEYEMPFDLLNKTA